MAFGRGRALGAQDAVAVDLDAVDVRTSLKSDGSTTSISRKRTSARPGTGLMPRCSRSLAAYSASSPAWRRLAMRLSAPSWSRESVMNRRAASSNSMRSARSSVVRVTREISETTMMPAMNMAEMAMPSGFSMTFSTRA